MRKWLQGGGVTLVHIEILARYFRVTRAWLLWGDEPHVDDAPNAQTLEGFAAALPVEVAHSFVAFMQMLLESNKRTPSERPGAPARAARLAAHEDAGKEAEAKVESNR